VPFSFFLVHPPAIMVTANATHKPPTTRWEIFIDFSSELDWDHVSVPGRRRLRAPHQIEFGEADTRGLIGRFIFRTTHRVMKHHIRQVGVMLSTVSTLLGISFFASYTDQ
jgi:hypothetical protein